MLGSRLKDTPTGQNTFHGTMIGLNQRDAEHIIQPFTLPMMIPSTPVEVEWKYLQHLAVNWRRLDLHFRKVGRCHFNILYALANYIATDDNSMKKIQLKRMKNRTKKSSQTTSLSLIPQSLSCQSRNNLVTKRR